MTAANNLKQLLPSTLDWACLHAVDEDRRRPKPASAARAVYRCDSQLQRWLLLFLPLAFVCPTDEEDKRSPNPASAARAVYHQQAEIHGKVDVRKGGFGEKEKSMEDKASRVSPNTVQLYLLNWALTACCREHCCVGW